MRHSTAILPTVHCLRALLAAGTTATCSGDAAFAPALSVHPSSANLPGYLLNMPKRASKSASSSCSAIATAATTAADAASPLSTASAAWSALTTTPTFTKCAA